MGRQGVNRQWIANKEVAKRRKIQSPPTSSESSQSEEEEIREPTPPPPTPMPATQKTSSQQIAAKPKRQKVAALLLTGDQTEEMSDWLKDHDYIYIKGRTDYKNSNLKKKVWAEQALKMGVDLKALTTWYESMRTRIGKLTMDRSGSGAKALSEREEYIKKTFMFLGQHIVRQPSRLAVSLKARLQPTATITRPPPDESVEIDDLSVIETPSTSYQPIVRPVSQRPTSRPRSRTATDPNQEELLETMRAQTKDTDKLSSKITGMLENPQMTSPSVWACWMGTMAENFHPTVLNNFYTETFQMVMRYATETQVISQHDVSRRLLITSGQGPPPLRCHPRPPSPPPQQQQEQEQSATTSNVQWEPPVAGQNFPLAPSRRHSSEIVSWDTEAPSAGLNTPTRPSSTPNFSVSDISFSGLTALLRDVDPQD